MAITKVSAALVDLDGGVVINESSADADFRVESNGNANMLFVDGGNDRVGIGTGTPDSILDIEAVHSQLRLTDSDDSKFVLFSYSSGKLIVRNNSTDTTDNIYALQEDGNFGIGTHSPSEKLHIATSSGDCTLLIEAEENSSSREPHLQLKGTNTSSNPIIEFGDSAGFPGTIEYENSDNSMRFGTNAGERMRITSAGILLVGATSGSAHTISKSTASGGMLEIINSSTTAPSGAAFKFTGQNPNDGTSTFFTTADSSAYRGGWLSNGGVQNYQANNSNLSDRREKTNFNPAKSYLDIICGIPVQTFNYIDQNMEDDDSPSLGVVAQDVQATAPELVVESNWGTKDVPKMRLSIYQTDFQYALMKCVQELTTKLEAAEARITTLEG